MKILIWSSYTAELWFGLKVNLQIASLEMEVMEKFEKFYRIPKFFWTNFEKR